MACGTPVVACRAGALPEVMELAQGGLLVERDDPEALARGIMSLADRPETRARLAARGREQVASKLNWRRIAAATAEVYAEVLSERRGRPTRTMTSARSGR